MDERARVSVPQSSSPRHDGIPLFSFRVAKILDTLSMTGLLEV
jgi:hypothetical protein